ncbi:glycosyltransferase family 4 protein [Candidatus Uhrbacteria bacterium]|nr:glycosyltransferase family 4 protein [Candidatus Uhrbacteria bacterium]
MVIAIDVRSALGEYGGIPLYTKSIVRHLLALPSYHTFILFSNSYTLRAADAFPLVASAKMVDCKIPNKLLSSSIFFSSRPYLDKIVEKKTGMQVDVWFSPNLNFTCVSPQCATVLTAHDLSFEFFPEWYSLKMRFWHRAVMPRTQCKNASHIISVSHHTKNDLISLYGVSEKNVSVIYHGLDNNAVDSTAVSSEELDVPSRYILIAGANSKRKNLHTLIQSFYQLKHEYADLADLHLLVTGAREAQPSQDIRFLGFVSRAVYLCILRNAEALVYPSFYEGFGLPLLEAFRVGTPVIASAHSGLSEIGNGAFYPVDPYDTGSVVRALAEVLRDNKLKEYLKNKGFKRVKDFSWNTAAHKTLRVLEQCKKI